jgi:hypothetical protein
MTEVQSSKQLSGTTRLWRYLSLDKLVDLLSTSELFFHSSCDLREDQPLLRAILRLSLSTDC